MGKRRRSTITVTKIAVAIAAATTVFAMAASGIVFATGGRNYAEQFHQLALFIMLMAYVFLIVALTASKKNQPVSLSIVEKDDCLVVSPCGTENYAVLDQASIEKSCLNPHDAKHRNRRGAIRFLIARDVAIPDSFLDALTLFPNLVLLDLQNAKVSLEFWLGLEDLPSLTHVLATNAISEETLRTVSLSLPEVKFWVGKRRNLVVASRASQKPPGARNGL